MQLCVQIFYKVCMWGLWACNLQDRTFLPFWKWVRHLLWAIQMVEIHPPGTWRKWLTGLEQFQGRVFVAAEVRFGRDQALYPATSLTATWWCHLLIFWDSVYLDTCICFWCYQVVVTYPGCSCLHHEGLAPFFDRVVSVVGETLVWRPFETWH